MAAMDIEYENKQFGRGAHTDTGVSAFVLVSWLHKSVRRADSEDAAAALVHAGYARKLLTYLVFTIIPEDVGIEAAQYIIYADMWFKRGMTACDRKDYAGILEAVNRLLDVTRTSHRCRIVASLTSTSLEFWELFLDVNKKLLAFGEDAIKNDELVEDNVAKIARVRACMDNRFTFSNDTPKAKSKVELWSDWPTSIERLTKAVEACREFKNILYREEGLKLLQNAADMLQFIVLCLSFSGKPGNGSLGRTKGMREVWRVLGSADSPVIRAIESWHAEKYYATNLPLFMGLVMRCTCRDELEQKVADRRINVQPKSVTKDEIPKYAYDHHVRGRRNKKAGGYERFFGRGKWVGELGGIWTPDTHRCHFEYANTTLINTDYESRMQFEAKHGFGTATTKNRMQALFNTEAKKEAKTKAKKRKRATAKTTDAPDKKKKQKKKATTGFRFIKTYKGDDKLPVVHKTVAQPRTSKAKKLVYIKSDDKVIKGPYCY